MYDLYSHITRVNQQLKNCEEGIPLTEEDIEKFGLEEDVSNIHKRMAKNSFANGKNSFQAMDDQPKDVSMTEVNSSIGDMTITRSNICTDVTTVRHEEVDETMKEDIDGEEIVNTVWLDSIKPKDQTLRDQQLQWFTAKIHKNVYRKLTISQSKFAKKTSNTEEIKQIDSDQNDEDDMDIQESFPMRGRGVRGRGVRGRGRGMRGQVPISASAMMPIEEHNQNSRNKAKSRSSSNSDMMSQSRNSSNSSLSIEESNPRKR